MAEYKPEEKEVVDEIETAAEEEKDLKALEGALAQARAEAETNLAGWQRAQADLANFKRRNEQEKEEMVKSANSGLILRLLATLDDLERALSAMPEELEKHPWVDGIKLIVQKLKTVLEAEGLSAIKSVGEPFDPEVHEAVMCRPGEPDMVISEIKKGYKLHDRLLRPAMVVVGSDENKTETTKEVA